MNQSDIFHAINDHKDQLKSLGLTRVGLYGSCVRGDSTPNSDIDLVVDINKEMKNFSNFMAICDLLESILGARVDVVSSEGISSRIRPYIEKEIIYEKL